MGEHRLVLREHPCLFPHRQNLSLWKTRRALGRCVDNQPVLRSQRSHERSGSKRAFWSSSAPEQSDEERTKHEPADGSNEEAADKPPGKDPHGGTKESHLGLHGFFTLLEQGTRPLCVLAGGTERCLFHGGEQRVRVKWFLHNPQRAWLQFARGKRSAQQNARDRRENGLVLNLILEEKARAPPKLLVDNHHNGTPKTPETQNLPLGGGRQEPGGWFPRS